MDGIEVNKLCKKYGDVKAVDNISFTVKKGEIFGLLGVNGAGKTTTINMLTGLLKKDKGTIKILGKDPDKDWEYVKNRINVSTAYYPLSDVLTIRENLKVYAKIYGVKDPDKRIDKLLKMFELYELQDRKVINLSSGEKTRTSLCKGLINNPQVLFLDECTVGLDPDIAEKTRRIIKTYNVEERCTILFTSHYMFEVEELCNRIAFMDHGKIIMIDTAEKMKRRIKKKIIEIELHKKTSGFIKLLKDNDIDIIKAKDNIYIFEANDYSILHKVFKKDFSIKNIHIKEPTLDDVFIDIARRK